MKIKWGKKLDTSLTEKGKLPMSKLLFYLPGAVFFWGVFLPQTHTQINSETYTVDIVLEVVMGGFPEWGRRKTVGGEKNVQIYEVEMRAQKVTNTLKREKQS